MPQLDPSTYLSQIFWLTITFGAMFLIMWRVAVPKIAGVLETRQYRISDNHAKAEALNGEAEDAHEAYQTSLAEARAEAHGEIQAMNQKIADEQAAKESAQQEKLDARIKESEAEIERAVKSAIDGVEGTAVEIAEAAVEKLLGESVDKASVETAVKSALESRA